MEFKLEDAIKYGVDEAIVINYFRYWIGKNKANDKHFYDGHYWTYNSHKAFCEIFPFWSEKQIRRILDSLVKQNVIIKGNYNKMFYDRTSWYAFSNEYFLDIVPNETFELPKRAKYIRPNGLSISNQKGEPIPISNTVNNTVNKEKNIYTKKESKFIKPSIEEIRAYCIERKNNIDAENFFDFYESKGWKVGKNSMKDWKACVRTWERNNKTSNYKSEVKEIEQPKEREKTAEELMMEAGYWCEHWGVEDIRTWKRED